jgi:aerobic carbon-monoxide dehydrogenase medium subunit
VISQEIEFFAPKLLAEALAILARHGGNARPLSGGMTLVPMMTLGVAQPEAIVSLNHIPELDYVVETPEVIRLGAMTRHRALETNTLIRRELPLLSEAASHIGDVQVRHRGTIGGSLAHSDPAADYPPIMLVTGARMKLASATGERWVAAREYFKGLMQTDLRPGEILVEVEVPKLGGRFGCGYQRLHRIEGNFPIVNAAAVIEQGFRSARLALGGVGETAILVEVEKHLKNGLSAAALQAVSDAAHAAAKEAPSDLNGDGGYRQAMARIYAQRAIKQAAAALPAN